MFALFYFYNLLVFNACEIIFIFLKNNLLKPLTEPKTGVSLYQQNSEAMKRRLKQSKP